MNLISSLFKGSDDNHQNLLPPGTSVLINKKAVKIIEKIGEGGFATVYSAKDNHSAKIYAVKHCKCQSSEQIQLIDREIHIMQKCATLDHPNIVSYYGTSKKEYETNGMYPRRIEYFILLEYMEHSLISYIKQHQSKNQIIAEKQLFEFFLDIINATYLLHAQTPPIAHRDIKIDNILITYIQNQYTNHEKRIRLKLCDFGSCVDGTPKICHDTQQINMESELIERFTTPSYRAPEMIDLYQRKELSTKVDIWALGCVFFLMAYYEHPFPEGAKMSILDAKYKVPDKERYSKKVGKILKMCFNRDPSKRPTTKQLSDHVCDIIAGGKGTLRSKSKKRSNSNVMKTELHLSPKQNPDNRRKSLPNTKEEVKSDGNGMDGIDIAIEVEEWDPFCDDDTDGLEDKNEHKISAEIGGGDGDDDAFFSNAFAEDFFGGNKSKKVLKNKSKRKKKKEKARRSRSKSPKQRRGPKQQRRPLTPQPRPQQPQESPRRQPLNAKSSQDPTVVYGTQLAQLISMGFNNTDKNLRAILRAKGSVQVAVNILITQ